VNINNSTLYVNQYASARSVFVSKPAIRARGTHGNNALACWLLLLTKAPPVDEQSHKRRECVKFVLMQHQSSRVSVIIPVYNSVGTLHRAVASVVRQTLEQIEILIIDDSSQDASLALAHELAMHDSRIRVLALPANGGKSNAMNAAIDEARGDWIAVLDADDWYEPERLATLVSLAELRGVALAADNQFFHDAAANQIVGTAFSVTQREQLLNRQTFIAGSDPYADFNYGMLKPIVRADFIRGTGLTYRANARLSEDFLYLVEFFAADGNGVLIAEPLYHWTQPFGTISRQWTTTGAGAWRYDFQAALAAHADVLNELRNQQDRELAGLLTARARAFRQLHHISSINRMRASGASLPKILSKAACHPSIWPRLARRILGFT
jgi:succinoglycan biosynthesis protein ExoO